MNMGKHTEAEPLYRRALEGFERVVMRWPDAATQLERVLADADRLLLNRVGAFADPSTRHDADVITAMAAPAPATSSTTTSGAVAHASSNLAD